MLVCNTSSLTDYHNWPLWSYYYRMDDWKWMIKWFHNVTADHHSDRRWSRENVKWGCCPRCCSENPPEKWLTSPGRDTKILFPFPEQKSKPREFAVSRCFVQREELLLSQDSLLFVFGVAASRCPDFTGPSKVIFLLLLFWALTTIWWEGSSICFEWWRSAAVRDYSSI